MQEAQKDDEWTQVAPSKSLSEISRPNLGNDPQKTVRSQLKQIEKMKIKIEGFKSLVGKLETNCDTFITDNKILVEEMIKMRNDSDLNMEQSSNNTSSFMVILFR